MWKSTSHGGAVQTIFAAHEPITFRVLVRFSFWHAKAAPHVDSLPVLCLFRPRLQTSSRCQRGEVVGAVWGIVE